MQKYYNIKEAAQMCGLKVRTMREWIRDKKIVAIKQENAWYWMIPESEITRINNEHKD